MHNLEPVFFDEESGGCVRWLNRKDFAVTGRVQSFVPAVGQGILRTETGQELRFSAAAPAGHLQGGDILEFTAPENGDAVTNVALRHRWAEVLNQQHRQLINLFHDTIKINE